jgi:alkanesulfonate monooxygenase SsuD/methylene tetrahydromethanopterin reductase-like flavin-dependent oxidoreductase (luciferase family)
MSSSPGCPACSPASSALAEVTAGMLNSMYGVPADRAREVAIAGTPAQVASQLAAYAEAGADLIVVVCDPAPPPDPGSS